MIHAYVCICNHYTWKLFLLGQINDTTPEDSDFGRKFIGVRAGGSLNIHGFQRTGFTNLAHTLSPKPKVSNRGME